MAFENRWHFLFPLNPCGRFGDFMFCLDVFEATLNLCNINYNYKYMDLGSGRSQRSRQACMVYRCVLQYGLLEVIEHLCQRTPCRTCEASSFGLGGSQAREARIGIQCGYLHHRTLLHIIYIYIYIEFFWYTVL